MLIIKLYPPLAINFIFLVENLLLITNNLSRFAPTLTEERNNRLTSVAGVDAKTFVLGIIIYFRAADLLLSALLGSCVGSVAGNVIMVAQFTINLTAGNISDRFTYNKTTCALYFDINSTSAIF